MGWAWFIVLQLLCCIFMVLGWFVLIIPAALKRWTAEATPQWRCRALNIIYGNPEDGVVGPAWYLPSKPDWLRAYLWSAWRNSTDNLKYVFQWKGGPFYRWENTSHTLYFQAGWNSKGLPVLSAGAM